MDKDEIKNTLKFLDKAMEEEYGKKWAKNIKITDVDKGDTDDGVTEYTVTAELDGEEMEFEVKKIKGKYYIDEDAMGSLY